MATFNLQKITIKNFRSIKNVDLDIKDGLFAIVGKNKDQPSTFNGAGKSSVVYALWWCLTGNSLGGEVLADDVINLQVKKDCKVECFFDTDQGEVIISRCRKDSEHGNNLFLTINGQDLSCHKVADTQERINQLLKVSFDVLKSTIILTSDMKSRFSELTPQARVSLLESIRDYSIWEKVRNESNIDIKAFDAEIKNLTGEMNQMSGSINTYNSLIADLRTKYREESNRLQNINYDKDIQDLENQIQNVKNEIDKENYIQNEENYTKLQAEKLEKSQLLQESVIKLSGEKELINQEYQKTAIELNNSIQNNKNLVLELHKDVSTAEFDKKMAQNELNIINQWFVNDTCPTCHRKLDRTETEIEEKNREKASKEQIIASIDEKMAQINAKISTVESENEKLAITLQENEKMRLEAIRMQEKTYEEAQKDTKVKLQQLEANILNEKNAIEGKKSKINTYNAQISQFQNKITLIQEQKINNTNRLQEIFDQAKKYQGEVEELEHKKLETQDEITKLEKKKLHVKFFYDSLGPRGNFRGVLLGQDIAYINQCIKSYAQKFFTDTEIYLTTPTAEKPQIDIVFCEHGMEKPVSNLSSGEQKRCNLAIQLAIYELVQSTSLFNFNLRVFDEIESSLDPAGVEQLLEVIDDRKEDTPTTWWITNNEMVSSNIINKIVATKVNGYTRVEYE